MNIISTLNNAIKFKQIHLLNRAQLILDSLSFSSIDELDYSIPFKLLNYLEHENEYPPWESALNSLSTINGFLKRTPNFQIFQVCKIQIYLFYKWWIFIGLRPN